jgi:hypothetical protein
MKINFPNPFGYKPPTEKAINALRSKYKFSDAYANFLLNQNGLSLEKLEQSSEKAPYVVSSESGDEGCSDLRNLYGLDSGDEYSELRGAQVDFIFSDFFYCIGSSPGGNPYVEVLHGEYKGYIGSLDHELFLGNESLEEYVEEAELEDFDDLSMSEKTDALCDSDTGLVWFHAKNLDEFVSDCIYCDEHFNGYVVDSASLGEAD